MPDTNDDFEAEQDIRFMEEAEAIGKDPARQSRMKAFAERKRESFDRIVKKNESTPREFNGAVRGGMRPKQ